MRRISDALNYGRLTLKEGGIESFSLDALVLLSNACKIQKEAVFAWNEKELTFAEENTYESYIKRRLNNCPVQYIIEKAEFMGIDFYVDKNVLIPRSDTELLVELAVSSAQKLSCPKILDMCTGSGCIAISICHYAENAFVLGIDISESAIRIAKKNAERANVSGRALFSVSDMFEKVTEGPFDIIVSNPPYISDGEMNGLAKQVRMHEPRLALSGGAEGIDFYVTISREAPRYMKNGALLFVEIGYNQSKIVTDILNDNGFKNIAVHKDLRGYDRVISSTYMEV